VASPQGLDSSSFRKPCKGEITYSALTGLAMKIITCILGRVPQAITLSPLRGFFKQHLKAEVRSKKKRKAKGDLSFINSGF
jgi:hypothetical protein